MPTSGVIGSLSSLHMLVLRDTVFVHLGTVCFYEDTPVVTALQQEAVMSLDVIVDTSMISCGITASGAESESGWLGAVRPPRVLLADGIILVDAVQF